MSFVLRLNGAQVAISGGWNPKMFGKITGTSYPKRIAQDYTWSNGGYTLAWEADPGPTPEQVAAAAAAAAQAAADEAAVAAARTEAVVQYLRDHTPAEVEAYVQTNVTDLASARQMLKKFGVVLCVLAKQNFR